MMIEISVDIETLSLQNNALVLSLGACARGNESYIHSYCAIIEQIQIRHVDLHTIEWHILNNKENFAEIVHRCLQENAVKAKSLFMDLDQWIKEIIRDHDHDECIEVWMKSPSFDGTILRSLANTVDAEIPWAYREERDVRTIQSLVRQFFPGPQMPKPPVSAHDALVDAQYQLEIVLHCKKLLSEI